MTLALGSVLLSLLNLASAALIAERRRAGWLLALAAQIHGPGTTCARGSSASCC